MAGSRDHCHIRDILETSKKDMAEGIVTTKTMCGLEDPKMNTLSYGDPLSVLKRVMKNACDICIKKWNEEELSIKDYNKAKNKFRKLVTKASRMGYFSDLPGKRR